MLTQLENPMLQQSAPTSHQLTSFNSETNKKTRHLAKGACITIGEVNGKGYIANLWLTLPNWFWGHWAPDTIAHQSLLKTVIMRIYWDDSDTPAIEAPIGDFFGVGLCRAANFSAQHIGMSSGGFYSKFIMPFKTGFRIEFENLDQEADTEIFLNVLYQLDDELPDPSHYFHTQFHTGQNAGPDPMPIAEFHGSGKYMGCSLSMQGKQKCYLSYLEAPEFMYVDEDWETPRIIGTGLEDYFLGGWYFREGCFTGPLHGVPVKDVIHAAVAMYRIHDNDAVHFKNRFRMEFTNKWEVEHLQEFRYSSLAYGMLDTPEQQGPALPNVEDLLLWYRVRDIDHAWDGQ